MEVTHPTKPVTLKAYSGIPSFNLEGKFIARLDNLEPQPLNKQQASKAKKGGLNPDDCHAISDVICSPESYKWINDNKKAVIAEAARQLQEIEKKQKEAQKAQEATEAPLLAAMHAEADKLRKLIPGDHIEVTATKVGDFDGMPQMEYECNGITLTWREITSHGWASAIRPGALGAFKEIQITSISQADLELCRSKRAEEQDKAEQAKKTRLAELNKTVPAEAVSAYKRCGGDPENLADGIDDPDYWLVREYADAIEHQALAMSRKPKSDDLADYCKD